MHFCLTKNCATIRLSTAAKIYRGLGLWIFGNTAEYMITPLQRECANYRAGLWYICKLCLLDGICKKEWCTHQFYNFDTLPKIIKMYTIWYHIQITHNFFFRRPQLITNSIICSKYIPISWVKVLSSNPCAQIITPITSVHHIPAFLQLVYPSAGYRSCWASRSTLWPLHSPLSTPATVIRVWRSVCFALGMLCLYNSEGFLGS